MNRFYYRSLLARLSDDIEIASDAAKAGLELARKYQLAIPAGRMNFALSYLYALGGYSGEAIACLEEARTLLKDSGKPYLESEVHSRLSTAYFISGNYSLALEEAETSLELRRQNNDSHGEAFSLGLVGRVYNRIGRCQEARTTLIEAASIFRR
ncbi:tetratricopeptide repeat protein, partial [bacterium]|nr:tetratricopeptide repeat protein [bacterium]